MAQSAENDAPRRCWKRGHKWRQRVWGVLGRDVCARRGCVAQRVNPRIIPPDNDASTCTAEDMAQAWRDGWIVGNRWAFSDADADAIETNPYGVIPPEVP